MEKGKESSLFVNDGSFMERFKQLQHKEQKEKEKLVAIEQVKSLQIYQDLQRLSLLLKSKLVASAVKLGEDEDEEEMVAGNSSDDGPVKRQKLGKPDAFQQWSRQLGVGNSFLSSGLFRAKDLAEFCHKINQQRNRGLALAVNLKFRINAILLLFDASLLCCYWA
ncbi:hypothetical protein ACH5RR_023437 [Cinchona calisaya]|uniref:Uncharacterized protein n=1 Tax=Cinchona calisaya TaxID=153742 RepID=A0ABD2ZDZ6_9GENT